MSRDDAFLLDILLAARKAVRYTDGSSLEEFIADQLLQDAVMRQIQIMGEAASRITLEMRETHPDIPWHEMIGMRHRLVHDYAEIDLQRVWDAARISVPDLIVAIEPLVPPDAGG
jgi:uncharacterized protein with HEPN domain